MAASASSRAPSPAARGGRWAPWPAARSSAPTAIERAGPRFEAFLPGRCVMQMWKRLAAVLLMIGCSAYAAEGPKKTWTFEDDEAGSTPKGFTPSVGEWKVVTTDEGRALAQSARNANPVFNIALVDDTNARDVDISVKLKAIAGGLDQGG